jgi:beta-lactamase regulating signal transducer with metallopeptidase domain
MEKPRCFTVGGLRPTIFVSEGMLAALSASQQDAMLAHEQAHCRHKDSAWALALHTLYSLFFLPGSGVLLTAWEETIERACDLAAAQQVGSPYTVAEALVHVGSLTQVQDSTFLERLAFGAKPSRLEARVNALLTYDPTCIPPKAHPVAVVVGFILVAPMIVIPALAHLVELFVYH